MIRYAIIGAGRIGTHHAKELQKLENTEIVAVCDVNREAANTFAEITGAKVYENYLDLLDYEQIDAVYLCTPVRGRVELVKEITARKIHLYIEKPLAQSVSEGEEIVRLIQESSIICTAGFQWRSMGFVQKAKELIGEEPISLFVGKYYWTVPLVNWIRNRHLGGGQTFDQTIHIIDLATYLAGEIDHVYSAYTQKATIGEMENWDGYSTTAVFKNGTVGNFYSTYALYPELGEEPSLEVIQKNRLIKITPTKLTIQEPGKMEIVELEENVAGINRLFHEAIANKDKSKILATAADALHSLKVVLSANYSAVKGEVIKIEELHHFGIDYLKETSNKFTNINN
ncbi:Gfo/Idh/MocA family protein [Niallia sp. 03133]|uniref:Gfo/Idh/MocA family protein n=1 Tax=Niallia sp. 03133 TaxID=3458060 RepID=UPI00404396E6